MTTTLGSIVKAALDRRGISQADLSRETGVPVTVISHIIHDRRGAGTDYATKLAAALGLEPGLFDIRAMKRKGEVSALRSRASGGPRRPRVASPASEAGEREVA